MTEHENELLAALLAERFPTAAEVAHEARVEVPPALVEDRRAYRRGGAGLTRLEILLLQAKRGAA